MTIRIVALTCMVFALGAAPRLVARADGLRAARHHFTSNGNFGANGDFAPAIAGFDIADVSSRAELDRLPSSVKGLFWLGHCDGANAEFQASVAKVIDHPRLFGFYLMDDPDPFGVWNARCDASKLMAQSDWIHAHRPDALAFVALMNLAKSTNPSFGHWYNPETTHADLFGIAPYPCRVEWRDCAVDMIDRFVEAAIASGIPREKIVPTYQTFGFGDWRTDTGGRYRLAQPEELSRMLERWNKLVPAAAFDFTYSWGTQRSSLSLQGSQGLQDVLRLLWAP